MIAFVYVNFNIKGNPFDGWSRCQLTSDHYGMEKMWNLLAINDSLIFLTIMIHLFFFLNNFSE